MEDVALSIRSKYQISPLDYMYQRNIAVAGGRPRRRRLRSPKLIFSAWSSQEGAGGTHRGGREGRGGFVSHVASGAARSPSIGDATDETGQNRLTWNDLESGVSTIVGEVVVDGW